MNAFDFSILSFLNSSAGQHLSFDKALIFLANNGFLRGGVIAALCWWAWFKNGEPNDKNKDARGVIISTMLACFVSIPLARLIVLAFPFRVRPLCDPTNGLHFPAGSIDWVNWSSFPSDHAIMFFTLTTCLFFISRLLGWIALLDSIFLVCLPRIYLGIHYPTDVLAGAAIGVGTGLLANQKAFKSYVANRAFLWIQKSPGSFYAVFFLFMYQITVIFWDIRYIAIASIKKLLNL